MKLPIRTSIALDEETLRIFEKLKEPNISQSDIVRRALKFYYTFRGFSEGDLEALKIRAEMLTGGEHVIVDLDHLVTMLRIIESTPQKDKFWEEHRRIAQSHAEQFRYLTLDKILKRLEACNFFRLVKI
ncbi:MAG: ribbon-helix-helix protein, CopG family [Candidatus Methanomethylicaceae archaeon]